MYFGTPGTTAATLTFQPAPGPALQPDRPLNLQGSILGTPVRTDSAGTFAYLGTGNGSSMPEQYLAYDPDDPDSTAGILPGGLVILKSKVGPGCWQGFKLDASRTLSTSGWLRVFCLTLHHDVTGDVAVRRAHLPCRACMQDVCLAGCLH